jgi:hypothetical protein
MNENDLIEIQLSVNRVIYETVTDSYAKSLTVVDENQAFSLIVSALATNLGVILAQLPDDVREEYFLISKQIIDESLAKTIKTTSYQTWGHVGHA